METYVYTHLLCKRMFLQKIRHTHPQKIRHTHREISSHRKFYIHRETFAQIMFLHPASFYTQKTLPRGIRTHTHAESFANKGFYTNFAFKTFYTQVLSHTKTFAHPCLYTHRLWRVDAFTHTHVPLHTHIHTHAHTQKYSSQKLLRTIAFSHTCVCIPYPQGTGVVFTQKLLHAGAFTHRYTRNFCARSPFTHTDKFLH